MRDLQIQMATSLLYAALLKKNAFLRVPYDMQRSRLYLHYFMDSLKWYDGINRFLVEMQLIYPGACPGDVLKEETSTIKNYKDFKALAGREQRAFKGENLSSAVSAQLRNYKAMLLESSDVNDIMTALNLF